MSTSLSVDASITPTPSGYKMNGVSPRTNLNLNALSVSKPSLTRLSPTDFINSDSGTGKPLLNLSPGRTYPCSHLFFSPKSSSKSTVAPQEKSAYQTMAALALVCLLALLMALLAVLFLDKLSPRPFNVVVRTGEYVLVHQVSVALSTLTISLNMCCVFVCFLQLLFIMKFLRGSENVDRIAWYLMKTSCTRTIAAGCFFLSIPIFCTGVILFTFISFHESSAIVTSVVMGIGIIFCGAASVHNMYLWQGEKISTRYRLSKRKLHETSLQPDLTAHVTELSTLV
ncbi:uncharacterized protein LOC106471314 [Limulus polyphemus]|uniref:Uncharacterized protein LOC106471314 n=1 Tax=Limulus polyphemus TaxID=6850 RepID=A0ABM1BRP7_LIMPO|nr:uncharacterized protein LOC106471314 [Limulus polyphemus]